MTIILVLYVASGLLLVALSIPLIRRNVAPNPLYGFRVQKTLSDRAIWYESNAYAGKCLLVTGVVTIATCIILYPFPINVLAYTWICLAVMMGGMMASVVLSFRFLAKL